MILLERVAEAARKRAEAEERFRKTLADAKRRHSWAEIAGAAGLSRHGVRYLVNDENSKRRERAV